MLEVAHATSARRLSALGLLAPLVRPQLRAGVAALRTLYGSDQKAKESRMCR